MNAFKKILKYLVVYGLLLVFPAVVVAIVLVVKDRLNGGTMDSDTVWNSPYMVPAMAVGVLLNIIVFLWRRWAVLELGRISRSDVWMVIVMAVVAFLGWFFPEDLLQRLIEVPGNLSEEELDQMTGGVVGLIGTGILTPVAEELLCRGAILGTLLLMMPRRPWVCIVVSALIFGLIHLNPVQIVFGSLYGLLLGWLFWRTRSLLPSIVVHVANNTTVLLLPESADNAIENMSLTTEMLLSVVSLIVLFVALRWFAHRYRLVHSEPPLFCNNNERN